MSEIYDDSNRQVIPRWYTFPVAATMGDALPAAGESEAKFHTPAAYEGKVRAWLASPNLFSALDLAGTALIEGRDGDIHAREAALSITGMQYTQSMLAELIVGAYEARQLDVRKQIVKQCDSSLDVRSEISELKRLVRFYPLSAISWSDLAFLYALKAQRRHSERCMSVAVTLGGDNRFVLRSAARCFLHFGDPEKALFYLRKSPIALTDPWITAAEIAISQGVDRAPQLLRQGRRLVANNSLTAWSRGELAASLGTLEARDGSLKKSKRLLRQSLISPSENTWAQALWLFPDMSQEIVMSNSRPRASFEAESRLHYRNGQYEDAVGSAVKWSAYQPASSRPVVMASFVLSVCLQRYTDAVKVIESASDAAKGDVLLLNNWAFALASVGDVGRAERILNRIDVHQVRAREEFVLRATRGLISFRSGRVEQGRELYRRSLQEFLRIGEYRAAATASAFWAREELRNESEESTKVLQQARDLWLQYKIKELDQLLKSLEQSPTP